MLPHNHRLKIVKQKAKGHWKKILGSLARIPEEHLDGDGHPCVCCGEGHDRFNAAKSVDDTGTCFCRRCGMGGDGFSVMQKINGCDLQTAVNEVGEYLNGGSASAQRPLTSTDNGTERMRLSRRSFSGVVSAIAESIRSKLPVGVTIPDDPIIYRYQKADGAVAGAILRWDRSDGKKEIRPVSHSSDGWRPRALPSPRPLFRLREVIAADAVYVCEGEKTVEAVESFGLVATTSVGGCQAPTKTDWSPLDGKKVIILPDNDPPGEKYAEEVARLISEQAPGATIKIARLRDCWPEVPEKGDAADWSAHFDGQTTHWFCEELKQIAKPLETKESMSLGETRVSTGLQTTIVGIEPVPFPVDTLPERFRQMADAATDAIGVDNSFLILPMLTSCSTAIGNSRYVSTDGDRRQPLMLWTGIIGPSGTQKSDPFDAATDPIAELHDEIVQQWQKDLAEHEIDKQVFKVEWSDWKKSREGQPPVEPQRPPKARLALSDFSYESLVEAHAGSSRAILIRTDELSQWFGSFDRYAGSGAVSSEQAAYLSAYDGKSLTSDRVTTYRHVPRAFLNVSGTIQPGILKRCFTDETRQNGLSSRLWMAWPNPVPYQVDRQGHRQWSQTRIPSPDSRIVGT